MLRHPILFLFLLLSSQTAFAVDADSVSVGIQTLAGRQTVCPDTANVPTVKAKDFILPGALIAVGAAGLIDGWGRRADKIDKYTVKEWRKLNSLRWDNLIQYAPTLLGMGLNVCGAPSEYSRQDRLLVRLTSFAVMGATVYGVKKVVKETRPSGEDNDAFPSGHTATAFMGAEVVREEYGGWYGAAAYAMAIGVGVQRFTSDQHWVHDVVAGAGFGILCARVAFWLLPIERKLFGLDKRGDRRSMAVMPYYNASDKAFGGTFVMSF